MEKAITAYAAKDKEVKARVRADKQRWLNDLTKRLKQKQGTNAMVTCISSPERYVDKEGI